MKSIGCALLIALAVAIASSAANAASPAGHVESPTLAEMGLTGLQPLSDAQGQQVRGSFVFVRSISFAPGDADIKPPLVSGGAPRFQTSSASGSFSIPFGTYRARSRGFAFAAAN